jgi:hypothetical protein
MEDISISQVKKLIDDEAAKIMVAQARIARLENTLKLLTAARDEINVWIDDDFIIPVSNPEGKKSDMVKALEFTKEEIKKDKRPQVNDWSVVLKLIKKVDEISVSELKKAYAEAMKSNVDDVSGFVDNTLLRLKTKNQVENHKRGFYKMKNSAEAES